MYQIFGCLCNRRCNLDDGGDARTLVTGVDAEGLAVDTSTQTLYWTNHCEYHFFLLIDILPCKIIITVNDISARTLFKCERVWIFLCYL